MIGSRRKKKKVNVSYVCVRFYRTAHEWEHYLEGRIPRGKDGNVNLQDLAAALQIREGKKLRVSSITIRVAMILTDTGHRANEKSTPL